MNLTSKQLTALANAKERVELAELEFQGKLKEMTTGIKIYHAQDAPKPKRQLSAAGRAAIAAGMRRRWRKHRQANGIA